MNAVLQGAIPGGKLGSLSLHSVVIRLDPQQRFDTCEQLRLVKGLLDEVVCPSFERADPFLLIAGGDHHHRQVARGWTVAEPLADLIPVEAGHYDIVFVESSEHAYSHIKRVQPNLVILCMRIEDRDGFQVLSMLKLDSETKGIPVVTCTVTSDDDVAPDEPAEPPDDVFSEPPAICMN